MYPLGCGLNQGQVLKQTFKIAGVVFLHAGCLSYSVSVLRHCAG